MSDERLRQLERRLRAEPGDVALALELANERVRLGLRRPATSWEREEGGRNYFASVGPRQVVVGERGSSPFDEAAGSVSHAAFLQGQYQDTVLRNLGPEVLAEMLEAALRAPELFAAENAELVRRQRHLAAIPYDPGLAGAARVEGPVWWAGTLRLTVPGETLTLEVAHDRGQYSAALVEHGTGRRLPLPSLGLRAAVGIGDRFYVATDSYLVVEPTGEVIRPPDAGLFGSELRLDRVARLGDAAVFSYWWFDREQGAPGLLRYEHGKGFVARCER